MSDTIAKLDPNMATRDAEANLDWYDATELTIEGKAYADVGRFYARLPARAEGVVRQPVWDLSQCSAGIAVRFETDSTGLALRWELLNEGLAMTHMPATGVSGIDVYAEESPGRWRWAGIGRPEEKDPRDQQRFQQAQSFADLPPAVRRFMLYLPLYNGVEKVEIGVSAGAGISPMPPRDTKPVLFYGTSILQGGCASRPGMAYPAILGRRLGREAINMGFSGNGTMDLELADLFGELDVAVYVLDAVPNMGLEVIDANAEPFVRRLRELRPDTPIVMVEDRTYTHAWINPATRGANRTRREAYRAAYDRLVASGVTGITYVEGEGLLGDDSETSMDGSHLSDVGFIRMAAALEPVIRELI